MYTLHVNTAAADAARRARLAVLLPAGGGVGRQKNFHQGIPYARHD